MYIPGLLPYCGENSIKLLVSGFVLFMCLAFGVFLRMLQAVSGCTNLLPSKISRSEDIVADDVRPTWEIYNNQFINTLGCLDKVSRESLVHTLVAKLNTTILQKKQRNLHFISTCISSYNSGSSRYKKVLYIIFRTFCKTLINVHF